MAYQHSPDAVPPRPPPAPVGPVAGRLPPSQGQAHAIVPDGHHAAVALAGRPASGGQAALHHVRGGHLVHQALRMTRQQLFAFGFFGILLVLFDQLVEVFSPFLRPLLWAVILAHVTFPLHTRLTNLLRGREVASAALLTVGIVALIVAPVVFFTFLLVQEAGNGYDAVNTWVQSGGVTRLPDELAKLPLLGGRRVQHMIHKLVGSKANVEAFLLQSAKAMSGFMVEQLASLVKTAFQLAVNFLVIVIALFFVFKDAKRLFLSVYLGIPLDRGQQ